MEEAKQWIPLEANPEVLTKFGHALGLPHIVSFTDVWSLELLDVVPAPRHAVLLLFPITTRITSATATTSPNPTPAAADGQKIPFFCKQTIANACGTIALLHAAVNAGVPLIEDSFLHSFVNRTRDMTPALRAAALQNDTVLDAVHGQFAQEGQTPVPSDLDNVDMHFSCFVQKEGTLYELDGRKDNAVAHGASSPDTLLQDASAIIRSKFMDADPSEHRFTIVALTQVPEQ